MQKRLFSLLTLVMLSFSVWGQQVDTVLVHSAVMNKDIKNVIILPESHSEEHTANYPVLFLLHGYSGSYASWLKVKPSLSKIASQYNMIIVCPDGENSWYWDSPNNPESQYETYVSKELISYLDRNYKTRGDASGRAITGMSMGGHGGFWLGIRHPEVFGAFGSMSGGLDILPFPNNWKMKEQLGAMAENKSLWDEHTVINQLYKIQWKQSAIIFDCGTDDFFYEVNKGLHEKMLYLNIPHDYIERPGGHTLDYWSNAIEYQILFFTKFFNKI